MILIKDADSNQKYILTRDIDGRCHGYEKNILKAPKWDKGLEYDKEMNIEERNVVYDENDENIYVFCGDRVLSYKKPCSAQRMMDDVMDFIYDGVLPDPDGRDDVQVIKASEVVSFAKYVGFYVVYDNDDIPVYVVVDKNRLNKDALAGCKVRYWNADITFSKDVTLGD